MQYTCQKCGKTMDEGQFYTYKDGRKTELCKKCLTLHIDNFDESTYLWLLEKMDVPYVPEEWNVLRDRAFAKDPKKMNGMSVFGKYLSKMKLKQWKDYGWADTERLQQLNAEKREAQAAEAAELDALYQEQYENGEINEAQYKTLISSSARNDQMAQMVTPTQPYLGEANFYNENDFIDEATLEDPAASLTPEDKVYLAMKWGRLYKPSEWIELEKTYEKMMQSFDIQDADSENTLILMCKTNLKANQAIDCGDIEGYQKLSKVLESQRKTAKWTAAQVKEEKGNFVDSIGELIAICEKEGFIPRFATDIPQDKVDATLKDQKDYIYKLVTQDLGFGQQIEDALKKIEIQRQMEEDERIRAEEQGDDYDPYAPIELTDEEMYEDIENIQEQIKQDLENVFDYNFEEEGE